MNEYHQIAKAARFGWRAARNLLCVTPLGRVLLFPPENLRLHFGRGDAEYAINVFKHHYRQLIGSGYPCGGQILEVGPGRNLGTGVLIWAWHYVRFGQGVVVTLWDVFPNMVVNDETLKGAAQALLQDEQFGDLAAEINDHAFTSSIKAVADGMLAPDIRYAVQRLSGFAATGRPGGFDLIYSQASIEHIWNIAEFWTTIIRLTRNGGWHSHRIDLADHGRRTTNYIEMLEWSPWAYWLTMRFVPGAINRWRAPMHLDAIQQQGMKIKFVERGLREELPIARSRIDRTFRKLADIDLRTTALDLVAVKSGP